MPQELQNKRIAVLATDGVEQVELTKPREAVEQAGAAADLIAPHAGEIQAMNADVEKADRFQVDKTIDQVSADEYDGLILPGGTTNPDQLRQNPLVVAFVREIVEAGKPVGAICHGPWTLIEADVVRGRTLTSYPSLRTDIRNAGGTAVDDEVVTDNGLVTSRNPDDLPAFCLKIIEEFAEGPHPVPSAQAAQTG